ncbi:MAG: hypothetical protein J3R72DRAFT_146844 [Linnemannia gamsii]|nr:MAG: hypothetical protein J3R72DRAFT_146844 [Linnemannia gamsii]
MCSLFVLLRAATGTRLNIYTDKQINTLLPLAPPLLDDGRERRDDYLKKTRTGGGVTSAPSLMSIGRLAYFQERVRLSVVRVSCSQGPKLCEHQAIKAMECVDPLRREYRKE